MIFPVIVSCLVAGALAAPRQLRNELTTDFEGGMQPWFDFSSGTVNWFLEASDAPLESSPAPPPTNGTKYLRVVRRDPVSPGTAVLRSPLFTAVPGDKVIFSFWIRSRLLAANDLEVYWMNGAREERLLSLSEYSSISNFEWRTASVTIPVTAPVETRVIITGRCGIETEDAIAIDNMFVGVTDGDVTSTSATSGSTSSTTTTTSPPGECPANLGDARVPCFSGSNGKCYCFAQYSQQWTGADSVCRGGNMKLLSIQSAEEQSAVAGILSSQSGLQRTDYFTSGRLSSGSWAWSSTGEPLSYTNWETATGEPNGTGDCLYINNDSGYQWADTNCGILIYFICEQ